MIEEHKRGVKDALWPAHMLARDKEYIHMESMANLGKIPKPYGFKVACFAINIMEASGSWVRPVAIVED